MFIFLLTNNGFMLLSTEKKWKNGNQAEKKKGKQLNYYGLINCCMWQYMWHDQEECVGYRPYCFWDIGKNSVPLFYIVFSIDKFFINSVTSYPIVMGFASKWSILKLWESGVRKQKWKFSTSDSFPWSCHIFSYFLMECFDTWYFGNRFVIDRCNIY